MCVLPPPPEYVRTTDRGNRRAWLIVEKLFYEEAQNLKIQRTAAMITTALRLLVGAAAFLGKFRFIL